MSNHLRPSLQTLPIEPVYHILDYLNPVEILVSVHGVCARLNAIIDTYHPYRVSRENWNHFQDRIRLFI